MNTRLRARGNRASKHFDKLAPTLVAVELPFVVRNPSPEKLPSVFDKPGSKWVLVFIVVVLVAAYVFKQHSA